MVNPMNFLEILGDGIFGAASGEKRPDKRGPQRALGLLFAIAASVLLCSGAVNRLGAMDGGLWLWLLLIAVWCVGTGLTVWLFSRLRLAVGAGLALTMVVVTLWDFYHRL
jgi:hypothetical protein